MGWTATNPVTGAELVSKAANPQYLDGHTRIYGKSKLEQRAEAERAAAQKVEGDDAPSITDYS